jgi:hypothetical protein
MPLSWSLSNRFGIQRDDAGTWHAGHVNDVLELSSTEVLAASESGGVWYLTTTLDLPLSLDWNAPDTTCLGRGTNGPRHFFCGGTLLNDPNVGVLYETDILQAAPLWAPWLPIALPSGVGAVRRLLVDSHQVVLLLATKTGLWYSPIPPAGAHTPYTWSLAGGIAPNADITGLALAHNDTVLAATNGGIFHGTWSHGSLTMQPSQVTGIVPAEMAYVILAVAPSSDLRAYAGCCHGAGFGAFVGMLRSDDGGLTWTATRALDTSTGSLIVDHNSSGYSGAAAVSPTDPNTLVLGYTKGPYVSRDGGDHFDATAVWMPHDDKHAYHFTATGRLYEANDGGVTYTDDLGTSFSTAYNRDLANLQFYGPCARGGWGRTTASYQIPGLIGGGLQDNNDVYCVRWPNGSATPWRAVPPDWQYDGQSITFLRTGDALFAYGDYRVAHWEAPTLVADDSPIPINRPHTGATRAGDGLNSGPTTIVNSPQWRNSSGKLMFAVAASAGSDLYGLFADDDGANKQWDYLTTVPVPAGSIISALNSGSGRQILVGARAAGMIWLVDMEHGVEIVPCSGLPASSDRNAFVLDIIMQSDMGMLEAFAVWDDYSHGTGAIYHTTDFRSWTPIGTGLPGTPIFCMATDWTVQPKTLFAATDDRVYVSRNNGASWTEESSGLPRRPHCSDLAFVTHPDGTRWLHLSTYGWSTWVTRVV